MEDIIQLLPDSVANQIAAGEVVQRPASIVKELVENSLDADAKHIQVLVVDGGRTCVQVIDDGKGMSETDARMAFERHATSKIRCASDLFGLTTMGFRGEALASIAAVAQVELRTRRAEDELGTLLRIAGSKLECQEPIACPVGSNFSVNNLFFNVPARRKFLKSNQTEMTNVVADFERIVLTHPECDFSLFNNGVEMYRLPETSVRQRILDVFGKKLNAELLPIDVETSLVTISGYVGNPESSKKRGQHQFFFVNGRYMRHPYFHSAVMHAYENLIPVGEHVSYFIYMSVDPASIDVNVHPTKTEIKFDNEQAVWQVLTATVKEALGRNVGVPTIEFDNEEKPYIPVIGTGNPQYSIPMPKPVETDYNPFKPSGDNKSKALRNKADWESLYANIEMNTPSQDNPTIWDDAPAPPMPDLDTPMFQYKGRYIVMSAAEGIMVVDQHRAHICVLYTQYMDSISEHRQVSQGMLFPEVVQFDRQELIVLEDIMSDLEYIGFDLANLGGGSYSINGIPSGLDGVNPISLLHELVAAAKETGCSVQEKVHHAIALTMARTTAMVYGQVLSDDEMHVLLEQLFSLPASKYTPDGLHVYTVIACADIDKSFR